MVCRSNGIAGRRFNTLAPMESNCEAEKTVILYIIVTLTASHAANSTLYNADRSFLEDTALRRIINLFDDLRACEARLLH